MARRRVEVVVDFLDILDFTDCSLFLGPLIFRNVFVNILKLRPPIFDNRVHQIVFVNDDYLQQNRLNRTLAADRDDGARHHGWIYPQV